MEGNEPMATMRQLAELLIILVVGVIMAVVAMYAATYLAPPDKTPWQFTAGIGAFFIAIGLWYMTHRWGIGFYNEPDHRIAYTSTIEKAIQEKRLQRWNNTGIYSNERW